jgi:adenine deaminase
MKPDPVASTVRDRAVAAARGGVPFDLLLTGGTVVDVGTGELRPADVGIVGSLIASVHPPGARADAGESHDVGGRYVAPGFIDTHLHFESSMLTPAAYAEAVLPHGTTTVFCDPHELANVAGTAGVRYAVDASRGLPVRFVVQAPSCVPPMEGLERSGADFGGAEVREMLDWPEVGGVAEVMDMNGVLDRAPRMVDVVEAGLTSGKLVCGHAFGLTGPALQAYMCAGITSDHEVMAELDVIEKLRAGMTVELRYTLDHLLAPLVAELNRLPMIPPHLCSASDDVLATDLLEDGHLDVLLRLLIDAGLDPVAAIRIATLNGAYRMQRTDLGLVGAGRRADLVVLSDLRGVRVEAVYTDGVLRARDGRMLEPVVEGASSTPFDTVRLEPMTRDDFLPRVPGVADGPVTLRVVAGQLFTEWAEVETTARNGVAEVPPGHMLQVAFHRYGRFPAEPGWGLIGGWGDWTGAIATTVAHDTHNLVVFGKDPDDMVAAANGVIAAGGGVAVARDGNVVAMVELPVAGLLSPLPAAEVAAKQRAVEAAAREVGLSSDFLRHPLQVITFSSLACLPGPHVTDVGLVDGTTGERLAPVAAVT